MGNRALWVVCALVGAGLLSPLLVAQDEEKPGKTPPPPEAADSKSKKGATGKTDGLVPIPLELPRPIFKGTPKKNPPGTRMEPPRKGPRPVFLAPPGVKNLALDRPVTASTEDPLLGDLEWVTDGYKEAVEGTYVELDAGRQYVQVDLGQPCQLHAVVIWHYHFLPRVYHDVVVQVAEDEDFITGVQTLFNNDHDNSSGLGVGKQKEYFETFEGKLVEAKGVKARYVRCYTRGSTDDGLNHVTEVEVFGSVPTP